MTSGGSLVRFTSPRRQRTAARGLPVVFLVMVAILGTAPSVVAHHVATKASASATCVDGQYVVEWRALSWVATDGITDFGRTAAPWRGLNQKPGLTISYRLGWREPIKHVAGVYTLTAAHTTGVVIGGRTHQFPSASGSLTLAGNTKGRLLLRVKAGPWGPNPANGRYETHRWSHTGYLAVLSLKGDCGSGTPTPTPVPTPKPPADPGATAASACLGTDAVIRVGLTNGNAPGGDAFTFTVSAPAAGSKPAFNQSVTVAADSATSLDVPVDENGTRTITAAGPGFSQTLTGTGDCVADPVPIVSDSQVCTDGSGAIRVTLTNDNARDGEPITFEVTSPATGSQPAYSMVISLLGGEVRNLDVPVDEDSSRTVTVAAPGMTTVTLTRSIDCVSPAQPVASAYSFCDGTVGTLVMNVANQNAPGGDPVTFTIDVPGAGSQPALHRTVVVAGGGSEELTEFVDEGTTRTATIEAPGMTTLSFTMTAACL